LARFLLDTTKCNKFEHLQFLEVVPLVRQHILGVAKNCIHRFVGNLTGFPAVK